MFWISQDSSKQKQYLAFLLFSMGELMEKIPFTILPESEAKSDLKSLNITSKVFQVIFIIITVIANGDSSLFHDF